MRASIVTLFLYVGLFGAGAVFANHLNEQRLVVVAQNVGAYVQEHQQIAVAKEVYETGLQNVINKAKAVEDES